MKVLMIYAHPCQDSYNASLKNSAAEVLLANGHELQISDLYQMGFDPTADWTDFSSAPNEAIPHQYSVAQQYAVQHNALDPSIKTEQEKLIWCDTLVLQFPL